MTHSRRDFLNSTLAAAAATATALFATRAGAQASLGANMPEQTGAKRMKILVLGGTGFIGPALVDYAKSRGHTLTLFNRGKTNVGLFPEVERLRGNRDPSKDTGLEALSGDREWDVVIDDTGYYPRHVAAAVEMLKSRVGHYIFVSSISAYANLDQVGTDETAELATISDPDVETMGKDGEFYGGLKVLCEQAVQKALPGATTIVRPGYIVGPGDYTDRFTYWPVRFARGGDVLVPGTPADPLQVIDVRDLSEWLVRLAEARTIGTFNACGPERKLTWGATLEACERAAGKAAKLHWLTTAKMAAHKDDPLFKGLSFPIWENPEGETRGIHTVSNARAVRAGLTFRPIDAIVADTLAWWNAQSDERRAKPVSGPAPAWISPATEAAVIARIA
jgi:2'-hydroxyisoflavone reductase